MDSIAARAVAARIRANRAEIQNSLRAAAAGNPFAAEPDQERRKARLQAKAFLTLREAAAVNEQIEQTDRRPTEELSSEALARAATHGPPMHEAPSPAAAEKVWDAPDFVSVSFLAKGARIARAVGRVAFANGRPQGSGFLIGEGLFITNHHVVPTPEFARNLRLEFDYELDLTGNQKPITRFALDTSVWITDSDRRNGLDYAIFAVGERTGGELPLEQFGWSGLSDASDKHMLGEFANIVQHPAGRMKEVVLRENRLVGRGVDALHYVADTEPGSSGSPVFNSEWRPIALHHWGSPWRDVFGDDGEPIPLEVNEGIRISSIVRQVRTRLRELPPHARNRIAAALDKGEAPEGGDHTFEPRLPPVVSPPAPPHEPRVDDDGRVSWTVPVEISVRLPMFAKPKAEVPVGSAGAIAERVTHTASPADQYRDRAGYKPRFIRGHLIPFPRLSDELIADAAPNITAEAGDDEFELRYHHFSVAMNRRRKLAFVCACNINGASAKKVNRRTKEVTPLTAEDRDLESFAEEEDGGREAESWRTDLRIDTGAQTGDIYEKQKVAGFPRPKDPARIARIFQRGHLVRRLDPVWGSDTIALEAEADTFHWTNCAPQVGFFNQGTAARDQPGSSGGRLWRAAENYVLRNAVAEDQRVTCFTGPVFEDSDRDFRGVKVPGRFFKIVVWAEKGELRSLALLVDQRPVITVWPESLSAEGIEVGPAEAFGDADELEKVQDFLSTVEEIERLTQLGFGEAVRTADVRKGTGEALAIKSEKELPLRPTRPIPRQRGKTRLRDDR